MDNPEWEPCEEYGHLFEPCGDGDCEDESCKIMICADCGDEYGED